MPIVDAKTLVKLTAIFAAKNWQISGEGLPEDVERYDRFCKTLEALSIDERDLFLTLTEEFEKFDFVRTIVHLIAALEKVDKKYFAEAEGVYVLPLAGPDDERRSKSGNFVAYPFLNNVLRPFIRDHKFNLIVRDYNSSRALALHPKRGKSLIFVVDDFVATGDTAVKFLDGIENSGVLLNSDTLIFVSCAAMETGVGVVRNRGYEIHTGLVLAKGISENNRIVDKEIAKATMQEIEFLLSVEAGCNFGHGQSEALVSFVRTPDNTFPVYWAHEMKDGKQWPATFPR